MYNILIAVSVLIALYVYIGLSVVWKTHHLLKLVTNGKLRITTPLWKQVLLYPIIKLEAIEKKHFIKRGKLYESKTKCSYD
jgi:presenilin-like A22 family membrane protease